MSPCRYERSSPSHVCFRSPSGLGESVTEGTVTRCVKQVGETVEADEPTEIPSPASGVRGRRHQPDATARPGRGHPHYFDTENIGIAVDTEKGLTTPVIKAAGDLSIAGIARSIVDPTGKARSGGLAPMDVAGATFAVSDTGSRGALFETVITPPNRDASLGIGATVKRPAVVETADGPVIGVRDKVHLSLSYDHRLVDGADAARYLTAVKAIVEAAAFTNDLLAESPEQP